MIVSVAVAPVRAEQEVAMSVLDALDATRFCTRWSTPLDDSSAWASPAPVVCRITTSPVVPVPFSWWSLARNPHALAVTGMVGAALVKDAAVALVASLAAQSR